MAATRSSEPSLRHNYPFSVRCRLLPLNCISSETNIRKITCLPLRGQSEGHFERHLTKSVWTEKNWTNTTNRSKYGALHGRQQTTALMFWMHITGRKWTYGCKQTWQLLRDTHILWRTHQPQCGSPELRHSPHVPYCSHDSMGTWVTCKHIKTSLSQCSQKSVTKCTTKISECACVCVWACSAPHRQTPVKLLINVQCFDTVNLCYEM